MWKSLKNGLSTVDLWAALAEVGRENKHIDILYLITGTFCRQKDVPPQDISLLFVASCFAFFRDHVKRKTEGCCFSSASSLLIFTLCCYENLRLLGFFFSRRKKRNKLSISSLRYWCCTYSFRAVKTVSTAGQLWSAQSALSQLPLRTCEGPPTVSIID